MIQAGDDPGSGRKGSVPSGSGADPESDGAMADDRVIGRAATRSVVVAAVLGSIAASVWWFTAGRTAERVADSSPVIPARPRTSAAHSIAAIPFTDVARAAGIDFVHTNGATGGKLLPETMGGGVAFLDADGDGDQDLLFVDGCPWQGEPFESLPVAAHNSVRLYTNDGRGQFRDATLGSGLEGPRYGMGVAVGELDGDGRVDLFITAVGRNAVFLNRTEPGGSVRFVDASDALRVPTAQRWGSSAAMLDGDLDGDLDVLVCNYVKWSPDIDRAVDYRLTGIGRAYGSPTGFEGVDLTYLRNDGAGGLVDATQESGFAVSNPSTGRAVGKALGVVVGDWNEDGRPDVAIANDTVANSLFRNESAQGMARFVEVGAASGMAFDRNGSATGAMGIDSAWLRQGEWSIAIGNFANEMSSLYVARGTSMSFSDDAIVEGLGPASRGVLTFGLLMEDLDLDGDADLVQANGHIEDQITRVQPSQSFRQRGQLFLNEGPTAPSPILRAAPADRIGDLARPVVGRGLACADIDADGDTDLVLTQAGGAPMLLRNDGAVPEHWLRVSLLGRRGNPAGYGAIVRVLQQGSDRADASACQRCFVVGSSRSYLSGCEPVVVLGGSLQGVEIEVQWPGVGPRTTVRPKTTRGRITIEAPRP